ADQVRFVSAFTDAFFQGIFRLFRPHGQHGDPALLVLIFHAGSHFQRISVKRAHNAGHAVPDQGVFDGVDLNRGGIRHLLDTNQNIHGSSSVWYSPAFSAYLIFLSSWLAIAERWIWLVPS